MKKLLTIIFLLISISVKSQILYRDSILKSTICDILYTDESSDLKDVHLKMHIDISDHGDRISGAEFIMSLFTCGNNPVQLLTVRIGIAQSYYDEWNANSNEYPYQYCSSAMLERKVKIVFK